jgi:hypothetical protein
MALPEQASHTGPSRTPSAKATEDARQKIRKKPRPQTTRFIWNLFGFLKFYLVQKRQNPRPDLGPALFQKGCRIFLELTHNSHVQLCKIRLGMKMQIDRRLQDSSGVDDFHVRKIPKDVKGQNGLSPAQPHSIHKPIDVVQVPALYFGKVFV